MDGSSRAAGIGGTITLANRQFQVRGRTVGFQAAMEGEIRQLRGDPMENLCRAAKILKGDRQAFDMVSVAVAERFRNWGMATHGDYAEFLNTPRGRAFQVWYAIKDCNEKPPSLEQVTFWLNELEAEWEQVPVIENGVQKIDPDTQQPVTQLENTGWPKSQAIITAIDFASGEDALGNLIGQS